MTADGFHPPLEEYLESILELEEEGIPIIQARLAERLGHSAPSVSEMIRRLRADGWIEPRGKEGKEVQLSEKGRHRAESVVRKHRLAERLLTDVIGLEWHKAHLEACRWEHVISDDVETRLIELLEHPETCPHGNPIPGLGHMRDGLVALTDIAPGEKVTLARVTEQVELDTASLTYLSEHHFTPGAGAHVRAKAPDGTITLDLDQDTIAVGPALAAQLFVTR